MKKIDKEAMANAYVWMSSINLRISNDCLRCENQGYKKGVEYIAV